jgi:hypothetical protein
MRVFDSETEEKEVGLWSGEYNRPVLAPFSFGREAEGVAGSMSKSRPASNDRNEAVRPVDLPLVSEWLSIRSLLIAFFLLIS